ncbi:MAG: hypothetical protein FJ096_11590 [Deltaproteobacteria bacterium]|nr:hypothetical protein [Deltaproteobacteria bacterium]
MRPRQPRCCSAVALAAVGLLSSGCNAVSSGSALSSVPAPKSNTVFLTTGDAPRPFKTLGFVQIRGYGVQVAGFADVGDADLDKTIKGALANEAAKMGGQAVIHIEFLDENPSTDAERVQAAMQQVQNLAQRKPEVEKKDRYVTVVGEVVQFTE